MKSIITLCLLLCFLSTALPGRTQTARKTLVVGQSEVYTFDRMTTAAVGSPAVADIVPLSSRRLLVNAKSLGQTMLFVCDHAGAHRLRLTVVGPPAVSLAPVAAAVQAAVGLPGVRVRAYGDTVFLEGSVPTAVAAQRAAAIAGVYAPKIKNLIAVVPASVPAPTLAETYAALLTPPLAPLGISVQIVGDKTLALSGQYRRRPAAPGVSAEAAEWPAPQPRRRSKRKAEGDSAGTEPADDADPAKDPRKPSGGRLASDAAPSDPLDTLIHSLPPDLKVINLLNLGGGPTRQILVRAKIIDINRSATKSLGVEWGTGGLSAGRGGSTYTFQPQPILFGQSGAVNSAYSSLLGGGSLNRISPFAAQLNALIAENKARVLSEPRLMVLDGCDGSILVGGEIPIPVAQSSSGTLGASASVAIEYKPYGVRLLVNASLIGDKIVQMTVTPEVSELNYGAGLQLSGFSVPALTVRRATSTLQMADGETLVIGGLYSSTASRQVSRIPLLSQIPVLGEFFKNTQTRKEESELLILIQPEIVTPATTEAFPPPPGSLENPPIARPGDGRTDFDKDFPELQHGGGDTGKPGPPVNLPEP